MPKEEPKAIVDQLNAELGKALRDPEVAPKMINVTYDPVHRSPDELAQHLKTDHELIGKVFRQFHVKLDWPQAATFTQSA